MKKFVVAAILIFLPVLAGCSGKSLSSEFKSHNFVENKLTPAQLQTQEPYQYASPFDTELYLNLFNRAEEIRDVGSISGAILPHHLVGGIIPANFFKYLTKQKPPLVIIFGPNHLNYEPAQILSTKRDWLTPFGAIKTADGLINDLENDQALRIDDEILKDEYSISSLVSFVKLALPDTQLAVFIAPFFTPTSVLDKFIDSIKPRIPDTAVAIASVDFSHYQNINVANFHDELSRQSIRNFDYARLTKLDIDSPPSLYFLLKIMETRGTKKIAYESSDNSASILSDPGLEKITSYYAPYFVKGDNEPKKIASILNFGDMMLDRNVKKQIDENGAEYIFKELAGEENRFFMGIDLISANLEGPFANSRRATSKEIAFRFDPLLLPILKKYNFGIFSQANNHSLDMGSAGFEESKNNLKNAGFDYYGSQYRIDDESLLVKKVGDYKIGFIGLNDTNSPINLETSKKLIIKSKNESDYTVINIHWGAEYQDTSNYRQRILAHELIDAGADVIIGHHPHVIEEMEIYKNRPIFYSLGNFIFDQYFSVPTQQSLAVGLVFTDKSISSCIFPLVQNKSQVSQMSYNQREAYLFDWMSKCRPSELNFMENCIRLQI